MSPNGQPDVIVIGAGILGAAAAYNLAACGHRVVLLEKGSPNREGSGATAGNLHIQAIHTHRPGQKVGADNRRFLPLQVHASKLWDEVEEELGTSVELRRSGGVMVAETPRQVEELRRKQKMEREYGLRTELLTGDEARAVLPQLSRTVMAADWCADDGYANPLHVAPAYLNAAVRMGASVYAGSPVVAISRRHDIYTVSTPTSVWSAPIVINAAGPAISDVSKLAGLDVPMAPAALQMHVTTRIPPQMHMLLQHIGEGLSVKQVTAGQILIGGGWPAGPLLPGRHSEISIDSLLGNVEQACRVLPFLRELRLLRMWSGLVAATHDELPVIGAVAASPGFLVAGGTYAFTLAPLWGRVLAAMVNGLPSPVDVSDLGPDRLPSAAAAAPNA